MRKKVIWPILFIASVLVLTTGAAADESKKSADEILELVDSNLLKVQDSTYEAKVSVIRSGKVVKNMKFEVRLKGLFQKRVTFTAPGDLAGTSIVTTDDRVTYVYMPSFKKVRRVASHVNNEGFMGTDVSGEELGNVALSQGWNGQLKKETETHWYLKLVPKAENQTTYGYMNISVSKQYGGVDKVESFNKQGKKVKTQLRSEWKTYKDKTGKAEVTVPTKFVFVDHLTGSKTELQFLTCKVNQNIPDSIFTKRSLMRSN